MEEQIIILSFIRKRLLFTLLRTILESLRGIEALKDIYPACMEAGTDRDPGAGVGVSVPATANFGQNYAIHFTESMRPTLFLSFLLLIIPANPRTARSRFRPK